MDCRLIAAELALYHVGAIEPETRDRIDAHLLSCSACLRAYLALKRHAESGGLRPRDEVKRRLFDEVERTFRPTAARRVASALRQPIPLYQGVFAAILLVLAAALIPSLVRSPAPLRPGDRVDTSRPSARSLDVY